jgi:hypothetical protein
MEISQHKTRRRKECPPAVACRNRREGQEASHQIHGIHVQHKPAKYVSSGLLTPLPLRCERLYWDHGMDKAQKLFDRQADFIKIHRSIRVPDVKGAYYE